MTYGELRLSITKVCPGIDSEIRDGWIQDAYTEVLDLLPWKRTEGESVIQVPTSYITGTLTATQGSASIVGAGTVWTTAMNGFMMRIAASTEYYQLTALTATTATLDRPYEGVTGADLAYRIDQNVFLMPPAARIIRGVRPLHNREKPLEIITPGELNRISGSRNSYGTPMYAAPTWDSVSDPPILQAELWPVPDCPDTGGKILSFVVDYIYDQSPIDVDGTSVSLLPFVRPAALKTYCQREFAAMKDDWQGVDYYGGRYKELTQSMLQINALQRGPQRIRLAPELQRQTPPRYRRGPWHRGFNG